MSEDIFKIPGSTAYKPAIGALGIVTGNGVAWQTCRDRFQAESEKESVKSFLFYHKPGSGDDVIEFIRTVEQIIRLPNEHAVQIKKTNDKDVIWIGMSDWWKYRIRRSLLTALLRCGQEYSTHTGPGFEKALWSTAYTAGTKHAVERFLSGYTACKLKKKTYFYGWQQFFATSSVADSYLVKLKRKKAKDTELTGELAENAPPPPEEEK